MTEEKKWTTMATIGRTFERAEAEGLGISKNLIRSLAKSGEIPSVLVGNNTRLINFELLLAFLYAENQPKEGPCKKDPGTIRRIEVR